ncbi:MAG: YckD family protein [Bacillaceae bacterium]|nr:YckD family protein [Bacillaceae bacterium]
MKRLTVLLAAMISVLMLAAINPVGAEPETDVEVKADVTLTDEQKKEMEALYKEFFDLHKNIIKKYVEYGVITQEKADKKMSFLDKHYEKLKENGFVMKWDKDKHKKYRDKKTNEE